MILVDTSVWINHLRTVNRTLVERLVAGAVLTHPFVVGELALGNLRRRRIVLDALSDLPLARVADDAEVLHFVERREIYGRGIGYVDAALLASVALTDDAQLWTTDKRLHEIARRIHLAVST